MMRRYGFGAALFCCTLLASHAALAFCRTTTCDPNKPAEQCEFDADRCLTTGKPLAWRSSCVTVGVHELGAPNSGLSFDDVANVVEQAFGTWMQADCGGAGPSIDVKLIGPIACGVSEYNKQAANANVVIFREDDWPFIGAENAIGLTTTRFDKVTGDLWDADIELNAVSETLTIGDPVRGADLLSVLTHEAGHFLGLSHSPDETATMKLTYDPGRDGTSFRTLAPDDVAGICAIYPPERRPATASCENRHGFSEECGADQPPRSESKGCGISAVGSGNPKAGSGPRRYETAAALLLAAGLARLARRRRVV